MGNNLTNQVHKLITGLSLEKMNQGHDFIYDGNEIYEDDVANLMMPSVLCISQELAIRVGLSGFGLKFYLDDSDTSGLPLQFSYDGNKEISFSEISPFVLEVFEGELMSCRKELPRLFEAACRVLNPKFDLNSDTNYQDFIGEEK